MSKGVPFGYSQPVQWPTAKGSTLSQTGGLLFAKYTGQEFIQSLKLSRGIYAARVIFVKADYSTRPFPHRKSCPYGQSRVWSTVIHI